MSRPPVSYQRTYATVAAADLRKTYLRDAVIVDDTGAAADVPLQLPKIGTAYAPVGLRTTIVKASNEAFAVALTPDPLDAISSGTPGAFPGFDAAGVVNSSALPAGVPSSVTLEATDMALAGSAQPNPSGGTPTTAGAWLVIDSGPGGGGGSGGTGTPNTIAKFITPTTLGDTQITDDGSSVVINAADAIALISAGATAVIAEQVQIQSTGAQVALTSAATMDLSVGTNLTATVTGTATVNAGDRVAVQGIDFLGHFAVADLPAADVSPNPAQAYATNARRLTAAGPYPAIEAAGNGTGAIVERKPVAKGGGWFLLSTNIPAQA